MIAHFVVVSWWPSLRPVRLRLFSLLRPPVASLFSLRSNLDYKATSPNAVLKRMNLVPPPQSLLDMLKVPTAAEINRKRKVKANTLEVGKRRSKRSSVSDPKGTHPSKCVMEFPNEEQNVSVGKLYYSACRDNRWYMSPLAGSTVIAWAGHNVLELDIL